MATGDGGCEAYTAIAWGVGLSHERSDVAGAESFADVEGGHRKGVDVAEFAADNRTTQVRFLGGSRARQTREH